MSIQGVWQKTFGFLDEKPVVVEVSEGELTSDAGLVPVREFDEAIRLTEQMAEALVASDPRYQAFVDHTYLEMVRMRVYGILADYEDQNDHDRLRFDPMFKLVAGRSPDADPLASQSTLSRFENAIDIPALWRLRDLLIDQFVASFDAPPARLTFDIDIFDDPVHGSQQLCLFNGYYNQYQYEPRVVTCADNDQVVMLVLLYGSAHPALGAEDDIEYLVKRLRAAWPEVDIELRADSGFGVPRIINICERLGIWFTIGLKLNPVLKRRSEELLDEAVEHYEATGDKQRLFCVFPYRAGSWPAWRTVIIKCEAHEAGTNRRAVLTNRHGAWVLPGACYDEYADRGESENRNKELKCGLKADRLSDHRYHANLFRLYLHSVSLNLLTRLRQLVADPPPADPAQDIPTESLPEPERRRWFNRRRERDPLGEGHPETWRTRLIKVAAEISVSSRRVLIRLSSCWPFLDHYAKVSKQILAFTAARAGPE